MDMISKNEKTVLIVPFTLRFFTNVVIGFVLGTKLFFGILSFSFPTCLGFTRIGFLSLDICVKCRVAVSMLVYGEKWLFVVKLVLAVKKELIVKWEFGGKMGVCG